jgi:hypothetical protein
MNEENECQYSYKTCRGMRAGFFPIPFFYLFDIVWLLSRRKGNNEAQKAPRQRNVM